MLSYIKRGKLIRRGYPHPPPPLPLVVDRLHLLHRLGSHHVIAIAIALGTVSIERASFLAGGCSGSSSLRVCRHS